MKNSLIQKLQSKKIILCIFVFIIICISPVIFKACNTKEEVQPVSKQTNIEKNTNKTKSNKKASEIKQEKIGPFTRKEREVLFSIVKKTIQDGLDGKEKEYPDLSKFPKKWSNQAGVFVTLNLGEQLRGCQGNENIEKPFLHMLVDASYKAAFEDPRFPKLTQEEFTSDNFNISISILGALKEMSFKNENDIIKKMRPFEHGKLLTDKRKDGKKIRGFFLPSVWKKRPDPKDFWIGLKKKAKLKKDYWSDTLKVYTFSAEYVQDLDAKAVQDKDKINQAIPALKKLFNEDGSLIYEVSLKTGKISDKHHLVRDMGTGYSLSYVYWATKDSSLKPIAVKFLNYANTLLVKDDNKAFIQDKDGNGKAGAAALLLLSLIYYEQASGDQSFSNMRKELANGLISLFEKDVGSHTSPQNPNTSPYYDGETWLALSVYNYFFPEEKNVAEVMNDLDDTMYKKYYEKYLFNFFHWGSQAAAFRYKKTKNEKMLDFMQHQVSLYIEQSLRPNSSTCAYLEGTSEVADAIRDIDLPLYKKVIERMETQIEIPRLLQKQATSKIKASKNNETERYLGLFVHDPKETKARNDVTQHCLISMLKAGKVFEDFE